MTQKKQDITLWGDDIPWLCGLREKGARAFAAAGWPNAKTEAWKYSYFAQKEVETYCFDTAPHVCDGDCDCHQSAAPFATYNVKFCNGKLATEHFDLPKGVSIKPLAEAIFDGDAKTYLNKSFEVEKFPFAALNTAYVEQGVMIVVERKTAIDLPIFIHYHQHDDLKRQSHIRNIFVLESGAKATIIEYFDGETGAQYLNNIVNEVYVRDGAVLRHYIKQKEALGARHIALNSVQVRQNAHYESFCAQGECALSRAESYVCLQQEGASAEVNGAYRLAKSGVSDITTNICHLKPHTISNQLVKGVVGGKAKGVFQGQIHIAPNAEQTEGYQLHRALLLSQDAEVDAKPELEIFADDVKCSHGNTCGDLDAEQLFYMQSRGIALEQAKQMLIEAHIDESFAKVENTEIRDWLKHNF